MGFGEAMKQKNGPLVFFSGALASFFVGTMYGFSYFKSDIKESEQGDIGDWAQIAGYCGFLGQYSGFIPGFICDMCGPAITMWYGSFMLLVGFSLAATSMMAATYAYSVGPMLLVGLAMAGQGSKSLGMGAMLGAAHFLPASLCSTIHGVYLACDALSTPLTIMVSWVAFPADAWARKTGSEQLQSLSKFFFCMAALISTVAVVTGFVFRNTVEKAQEEAAAEAAADQEAQRENPAGARLSERSSVLTEIDMQTKVASKDPLAAGAAEDEKTKCGSIVLKMAALCAVMMLGEAQGLAFNQNNGHGIEYARKFHVTLTNVEQLRATPAVGQFTPLEQQLDTATAKSAGLTAAVARLTAAHALPRYMTVTVKKPAGQGDHAYTTYNFHFSAKPDGADPLVVKGPCCGSNKPLHTESVLKLAGQDVLAKTLAESKQVVDLFADDVEPSALVVNMTKGRFMLEKLQLQESGQWKMVFPKVHAFHGQDAQNTFAFDLHWNHDSPAAYVFQKFGRVAANQAMSKVHPNVILPNVLFPDHVTKVEAPAGNTVTVTYQDGAQKQVDFAAKPLKDVKVFTQDWKLHEQVNGQLVAADASAGVHAGRKHMLGDFTAKAAEKDVKAYNTITFAVGNAIGRLSFGLLSDSTKDNKWLPVSFYVLLGLVFYLISFALFAYGNNFRNGNLDTMGTSSLLYAQSLMMAISFGGIFTAATSYTKAVLPKHLVGSLLGVALISLALSALVFDNKVYHMCDKFITDVNSTAEHPGEQYFFIGAVSVLLAFIPAGYMYYDQVTQAIREEREAAALSDTSDDE